MKRERLNSYEKPDRIGLLISFVIIAVSIISLVVYTLTGFTVPEAEEDGYLEIVRRTYFIKGVLTYTEFEDDRIVMTYLESEDALMQKFITYIDPSYGVEDGDGILVITLPHVAESQDELQYHVEYISKVVSDFNSLPDSEVLSSAAL